MHLKKMQSVKSSKTGISAVPDAPFVPPQLFSSVSEEERTQLLKFTHADKPLRGGHPLYRQGDASRCLYVVRAGSFKESHVDCDGKEDITGFYFTNDVIGLESFNDCHYHNTITALDTASVFAITHPYRNYEIAGMPRFQKIIFQLLSARIVAAQRRISIIGKSSAAQRLAFFLLEHAERMSALKRSATLLSMPMTRHELANYLGLTEETISRLFARFQAQSLIHTDRKVVHLLDIDGLKALCQVIH